MRPNRSPRDLCVAQMAPVDGSCAKNSCTVHAVISAAEAAPAVRRAVKTYATRGLHRQGFDLPRRRKWTRKGSVVFLWNQVRLEAAIVYVVREQGRPMELFVHPRASRFINQT